MRDEPHLLPGSPLLQPSGEQLPRMSRRLRFFVCAPPILFAGLAIFFQSFALIHITPEHLLFNDTVSGVYEKDNILPLADIAKRDWLCSAVGGAGRTFDLALPVNARVFIPDMTGPTNFWKREDYYTMAYYLFPRDVGVSLDGPARQTRDGFVGRSTDSNEEMLAAGYDVKVHRTPDKMVLLEGLSRKQGDLVKADWFGSRYDMVVAFLLPLFTALAGTWLLRVLFGPLVQRMSLLEQYGCGLGLGMMTVAAVTLGIKLCGFHGQNVVFCLTAMGALAELWRDRRAIPSRLAGWFSRTVRNPVAAVSVLIGLGVFLLLFRVASVAGLLEGDAVMSWALKAKIMHLYAGSELVRWFSNPALAQAHFDYPTLVPSLHSATYDSIGHVDEFVTKFWPVWMLLFLLGALASVMGKKKGWLQMPHLILLGMLLVPVTLQYVQAEGATIPMVFFTVLGCMQCALWLVEKDAVRLGLGLTFLFGAAMAKIEGGIFLLLAIGSFLLLPSARAAVRLYPGWWRAVIFCFLAVLPFICLRVQIPATNYESNWVGEALRNPGAMLANWPMVFLMWLARSFFSKFFADWIVDHGHFAWYGQWQELYGFKDESTLGLAWMCLAMTIALWFAMPARRPIVIWLLLVILGAFAALSGISAAFIPAGGAEHMVDPTELTQRYYIPLLQASERYVLPILMAWFATVATMLFMERKA